MKINKTCHLITFYSSRQMQGSNRYWGGEKLFTTYNFEKESPANAKGTRDSSACMKAHCEF